MLSSNSSRKKKILFSVLLISSSLLIALYLFFFDFLETRMLGKQGSCPNFLSSYFPAPEEKSHQQVFNFKHVAFSSAFESGNLREIRKLKKGHYSLMIGSDPAGPLAHLRKKNWFFFSAKLTSPERRRLKFSVHNLQYNWSMWKNGMVPVYKSALKTSGNWSLLEQEGLKLIMKSKNIIMKFQYDFEENEEVFFALSFPYTFSQSQAFAEEIQAKLAGDQELYFAREALARSNQNRAVELLLLSSAKNLTRFSVPRLKNLFPDRNQTAANSSLRLFDKSKKVVIVSARVHPAESASSYMFEGFLGFFLNKTKETMRFLDRHVLAMAPMLNPDGVVNGFTRSDVNGLNLNANYKLADLNTPSIYALKKFTRYANQRGKVNFYLDFHSHFTKRGFFVFGNPIRPKNYKSILTFPFLIGDSEGEFSLEGSKFGSDKSEESTSRKEIYKYTKLRQIYTIEANYWGRAEDLKMLKSKKLIQSNLRIVKEFGNFYKIEDFRRFGAKVAQALVRNQEIIRGARKILKKKLGEEIDGYFQKVQKKRTRKKKSALKQVNLLKAKESTPKFF